MDPSSSYASGGDDEKRILEALFDAFSSICSLEEIASAYCKAGGDVTVAGDILCQQKEPKSESTLDREAAEGNSFRSGGSLPMDFVGPVHVDNYPTRSKLRTESASVGSVSSILGKTYAKPSLSFKEPSAKTKPPKFEVPRSLMDQLNEMTAVSDSVPKKEVLTDRDIEEFLYSMLGDGFKLSIDMIREVLGRCGYDIKKSMEELLTYSTQTHEKGKAIDCSSVQSPGKCITVDSELSEGIPPQYPQKQRSDGESSSLQKKSKLPWELLESLFSVPERSEEEPKKRLDLGLNRTRVPGQKAVTKPLEDVASSPRTGVPRKKIEENIVLDETDDYHVYRRAAKQHWDAMKMYYEKAIEKFTEGDRKSAAYLLEEGRRHNQMAREANDKSALMIVESKKSDNKTEPSLDVSAHDAKEALHLLKFCLRQLANIPSFQHLKVIVGAASDDAKKGNRRMVIRFLEKKSIKWTEDEGNRGTIFIQLDQIDLSKLSSSKESH